MNQFKTALEKTRAWLDQHFDVDGESVIDANDPRYYTKTPYLLAIVGLRTKGARVAKQVLNRFIDRDGDFTMPGELENRIYMMGWLALGASVVERFDLAETMAESLARRQDPKSGGIVLPDEDVGDDVADVLISGGAGMGLVAAGKIDNARLMADRFAALLDSQPERHRFYYRFRRDGSVVAKVSRGESEKIYDLGLDEQRPAGLATVVNTLVWVGRATREPSYFDAARRYIDFVYSHKLDPARFGRATKFGWAMLNLYEETGDEDLLDRARHLGEVLVSHQADDGLWYPRPGDNSDAPPWFRLSYSSDCTMTVAALAALE